MQPTDRALDPGVRLEGTLPGGTRRPSRLGGFCPLGRHFPPCRNAAPLQSCAVPAPAPPGLRGVARGRDVRLPALPARGSNIGDDGRPGGTREVGGTLLGIPPVVHHHPPLPPSLVIHSFVHSSIPWPYRPPVPYPQPTGWSFPSGPRKFQTLSSPNRVCNCSGALLPRRQRGAVPARLGRTPTSCPSTSGGLGPGFQPRDLFHSHSRKKESSCS